MTRFLPPLLIARRPLFWGVMTAAITAIILILLFIKYISGGDGLRKTLEIALGETTGGALGIESLEVGFFPPQVALKTLRFSHPKVSGYGLSITEAHAPVPFTALFGGGRALAQALMHRDITLKSVHFIGEKAPSIFLESLTLGRNAQRGFIMQAIGQAQSLPFSLKAGLEGVENTDQKRAFHLEAHWGEVDQPQHALQIQGALALAPEINLAGQAEVTGPDLAIALTTLGLHIPVPSWPYALTAPVQIESGALRAAPIVLRLQGAEAEGAAFMDASSVRLSLSAARIGPAEDMAMDLEWSAELFTLHQARAKLWGATDIAAFGLGDGTGGFEGALDVKNPAFSFGAALYTDGDSLVMAGKPIINGAALDRFSATIKPKTSSLHLALEHKNASDLIRNAAPGPLRGEMNVERQDKDWTVSALAVQLGNETLSGAGRLALSQARPKLSAQLKADLLDASHWDHPVNANQPKSRKSPAAPAPAAPSPPAQTAPAPPSKSANIHPRWSRDPMNMPQFAWDADIRLSVARLKDKAIEIQGADITLTATEGVAKARISGRLFDGRLEAEAQMPPGKDMPEISTHIRVTGADAQKILRAFAGLSVLEGRVDLEGQLTAKGRSEAEWISSLAGNGRISGGEGRVTGFDLKAASDRLTAARDLPGLLGVLQAAVSGGQTRLTALAGRFTIHNGQLLSDDLRLTAEGGRADAKIRADLPAWTTESQIELFLIGMDGAPLLMRFAGPIDSPRKFLDANAFQRALLTKLAPPKEDGTPAKPKLKDVLKGLLR